MGKSFSYNMCEANLFWWKRKKEKKKAAYGQGDCSLEIRWRDWSRPNYSGQISISNYYHC